MAKVGKRYFTAEFKREAVALWETSGRTQTEVAGELGIMPTMLRRWQRGIGVGEVKSAAQPPPSIMASPAEQASEIAQAAARARPHTDGARYPKKSRWHGPRSGNTQDRWLRRAGPSMPLGDARRGATGPVRIHRGILQSAPHALGPQVSHSRTGREKHDGLTQVSVQPREDQRGYTDFQGRDW